MSKQIAPFWCSNAVATKEGWKDPVTGELYVSDKSLDLSVSKKNQKKSEAPVED